jgi:hypothetical protein
LANDNDFDYLHKEECMENLVKEITKDGIINSENNDTDLISDETLT